LRNVTLRDIIISPKILGDGIIVVKKKIIMDLTQEESDRLNTIISELGTTKVGFLRHAMLNAEKKIKGGGIKK